MYNEARLLSYHSCEEMTLALKLNYLVKQFL